MLCPYETAAESARCVLRVARRAPLSSRGNERAKWMNEARRGGIEADPNYRRAAETRSCRLDGIGQTHPAHSTGMKSRRRSEGTTLS